MKHSDFKDWRKKWRKNPFVAFFSSLRLTVTLLAFSMALVFFGTLDQVNIGINKAQEVYFESFGAVWKYPEEWPLGTKMVLVTHPENDLAKSEEHIAIDDHRLKDIRFLGLIDNTFHREIKSVFEDSDGALEPDPNLRFHTVKELKKTLVGDKFKNGYAAILPDSAIEETLFETEVGDYPANLLQADNEGQAIRVFVIKVAEKTWVFKLKGDTGLAVREQERFDEFVESADLTSGQASGKWDIPEGWEAGKESPMRFASFSVSEGNAKLDISVTAIPGDMGGLASNVRRWLGQIGLDPEPAVIPIEGQMSFTLRGFPVPLPGGYLLGGLLLINLLVSATFRYQLKLRHAGIWITHGGLALMLISELVTDLTDKESIMVIDEYEDSNENGLLDTEEDLNRNRRLDNGEDLNRNGLLDTGYEDLNGNGVLDPSEDLNENGRLDKTEDLNGNGVLDLGEDLNRNGRLNMIGDEDLNGNRRLDGELANYSRDFHLDEFALIDESDPDEDHVMSIPIDRLEPTDGKQRDFPTIDLSKADQRFPFVLKVKNFYKNTDFRRPNVGENGFELRDQNNRKREIIPISIEETFRADQMNFRSAIVELFPAGSKPDDNASIGNGVLDPGEDLNMNGLLDTGEDLNEEWLVSSYFDTAGFAPQVFKHNEKKYRIEIRRKRYYYDFHVKLLDFRFLRYPGTDRPKDYSSDVEIYVPGEPSRKTRIYMNHPLNFDGNTFFQAGFDSVTETQTRLQVVYNPGSMLPYIGVSMVGLGLAIQFLYHLFSFVKRRRVPS